MGDRVLQQVHLSWRHEGDGLMLCDNDQAQSLQNKFFRGRSRPSVSIKMLIWGFSGSPPCIGARDDSNLRSGERARLYIREAFLEEA